MKRTAVGKGMGHEAVAGGVEAGKGILMGAEQQQSGGQDRERQQDFGDGGGALEALA